jgi:hypothetical protein
MERRGIEEPRKLPSSVRENGALLPKLRSAQPWCVASRGARWFWQTIAWAGAVIALLAVTDYFLATMPPT